MKKYKYLIIVLIATCLLLGGGYIATLINSNEDMPSTQNSSSQVISKTDQLYVSSDKKIISYNGQSGKTALQVLKSLTDVKTQQNSYGEFVDSIGGVEAVNGKQFWAFYVNGVMASEGAGTYKSSNGEKIEWKLEDIK